jgi:Zn-dependent peptidase ImmA (M78 family)
MVTRQELARIALRASFDVRRKVGTLFEDPICIYDFAEKLGLEIWFVAGASFGGMYAKDTNSLFIPAERPAGRKAYTCAHELAHWWFKHGTRVDDLNFDLPDHVIPEECLANLFGGYLLMPRHAISDAFSRRNLKPANCNPIELYSIACQLGVGYETLLTHLRWSLNLINHSRMIDMRAFSPKEIRKSILDSASNSHLIVADMSWHKTAIDLENGDYAVVPDKIQLRGDSVKVIGHCAHGTILQAIHGGLTQVTKSGTPWAAMVRVSRKQFVGRGAYRHLADPDENE